MEVALPKCLASHADWGSLSGTGYLFVSLAFASLTNGNYPVILLLSSTNKAEKVPTIVWTNISWQLLLILSNWEILSGVIKICMNNDS